MTEVLGSSGSLWTDALLHTYFTTPVVPRADVLAEPSLVGQPWGRLLRDPEQDLEPPPDVPATWELLFELGHAAVIVEKTPEPIHQG